MSQEKEAQIKLYKTREDKELDKVIALENKVKVLDDIVYKTGQSVQTMNMLNRNCKTSFAKPEFLKKAQRANPRLYDIGCYNDNLALMLAPESDETIRLDKESQSKLSDLIRPFDYDQLNNLYDLFVPQREKSPEQHYFPKTKSIPPGIDDADFDPKEDLLTLERLLNSDPSFTLPPEEQKFEELKTVKPSSDELLELELKDLPPHLKYAFLEGTDKLPVIIAKDLKDEDKTILLKVLRLHKRAIAWKMSDIKGIDLKFCTHKILMEDNVKPTVQHQRRVNPKIYEVIKKEVIKLLEAGLIYPISNSSWVSPVHCVPKKGGITVIKSDDNELIPTRLITGWCVCIDYRKLNDVTRKDHFPLPFMDQML
ncbi:hypothetical protein Tco_0933792 [Tanacetum coccineum]